MLKRRSQAWWRSAAVAAAATAVLGVAGPVSASPHNPAGSPYKTVHVFERHQGQLRKVPDSASLPHTHPLRLLQRRHGALVSSNWSGYVDVACSTCHLRYIASDFTLPRVNCANSPDGAVVAHWVGLDGWTDATVEQAGADAFCQGGLESYQVWYEMYPAFSQVYNIAAAAGDNIAVSVYYNQGTQAWQLGLNDTTIGAGFNVAATCPAGSACLNKNAEAITEDFSWCPPTGCFQPPLADFGQVNYNGARVTSYAGYHGNLGSTGLWTSYPTIMESSRGVMAGPGPLVNGSINGIPVSDFSDYWVASN